MVGATGRRTRQEEEEENGGVDCKFLSQLWEEEENRKIEEGEKDGGLLCVGCGRQGRLGLLLMDGSGQQC